MKRFISWSLGVLLVCNTACVVLAQEAATMQHAPKITCAEPSYNFGEQETGSTVEHTYVLRNEGDLTLLIGKIRTSCGCTVASVSSREVPPGEETRVTARLSLKNRRGRQRKAITVESNDPATPKLTLYLEGDAVSQVTVQPNKIYFGQIEEDTATTGTVSITSNRQQPLQITQVQSQSPYIDAALETVEEGKSYRLLVSTKPPLPRGPVRGNVRLSTDNPKVPVIDVMVSGTVLDELTVAPTQIVLAEKGDPVTRYVVVRPGKTKVFEVQAVNPPVPSIEVHITQLGQNGYQIRLDNVVANSELDGKDLVITTDVKGKEEIRIPFKVIKS